jgi:hypothetical protein
MLQSQIVLFLALTFVVIVAIIMLSNDLSTAMMTISILASFFAISINSRKTVSKLLTITPQSPIELVRQGEESAPPALSAQQASTEEDPTICSGPLCQNTNLYGAEYEKHGAYTDPGFGNSCYERPQVRLYDSVADRDTSIDERNCLIGQRRARDKRCLDGWATKDAHYFEYFFADELKASEAKPWWSHSEY